MKLTPEMKKEMLADSRSAARREAFETSDRRCSHSVSFDEYLEFLNAVQELFGPFQQSREPTRTSLNKL